MGAKPLETLILVGTNTGEVPGLDAAQRSTCCGRLLLLRLLRGSEAGASRSAIMADEGAEGRLSP